MGVCKVRSNGSGGSVLLRPVSGQEMDGGCGVVRAGMSPSARRVQCVPRYGYGKAHNIKINEHSCNFNWNKNCYKT